MKSLVPRGYGYWPLQDGNLLLHGNELLSIFIQIYLTFARLWNGSAPQVTKAVCKDAALLKLFKEYQLLAGLRRQPKS